MRSPAPQAPPTEPARAASRRAVQVAIALSLVLAAAELWRLVNALLDAWHARGTFAFDDAFAFYRYADHVLNGYGLAWNPNGPQTFGCTSLLYALWVAALRVLADLPPWRLLVVGSFVSALLAVAVMGLGCARAARGRPWHRRVVGCGFVCLCLLPQSAFLFHVKTGMDTTTAILTNALLALVVVEARFGQSYRRVIVGAVLAYLTYLARPDNLLYAALFPAAWLVLCPDTDSGTPGRRWRGLGLFGAVLGGLVVLDAAAKTRIFGNPLPLPFYAKSGDFYSGYLGASKWNPVYSTQKFLLSEAPALAFLTLTVGRQSWRLILALLIPCVLTFAYLGTVIQIMGFEARFYYPALPFVLAAAYLALNRRLAQARKSGWRARLTDLGPRLAVLAALGLVVFPGGDKAAEWYDAYCHRQYPDLRVPEVYRAAVALPSLGWTTSMRAMVDLTQRCPVQTVWAMSEHGVVGAMSPNVTIIDLAGLHDRHTLTGQPMAAYALAQRPDVIWFPHADYTGMISALETSRALAEDYDYWPGAFDYGLAVRKQSPLRAEIERALCGVWRDYYQVEFPPPGVRTAKRES
jgi:hypothetical protein